MRPPIKKGMGIQSWFPDWLEEKPTSQNGQIVGRADVKKSIKIWFLILISISICACTPLFPEVVKEPFETSIKNNWNSTSGDLAVFSNDKIYYFSDEGELPGIYSMDVDGTNAEFVVECDDIKTMQIKDDTLFYLQYTNSIKDSTIVTRVFQLMKYDLKSYEKSPISLYESKENYVGTWDFYISDIGIIFNDLRYASYIQSVLQITGVKEKEGIYLNTLNKIVRPNEIDNSKRNIYLYDLGDFYCIGGDGVKQDIYDKERFPYITYYEPAGLYDKGENENIFAYRANLDGSNYDTRIIYQDVQTLYIAYEGNIVAYDTLDKKVIDEYQFPEIAVVRNAKLKNRTLLMLGVTNENQDCILSLDLENGKTDTLKVFGEKAKVVYYDTDHYIISEGKELKKYLLDENQDGTEEWNIKLKKGINKEYYKTDVAEKWLLISHWDKKEEVRKLDYKINIENGECF